MIRVIVFGGRDYVDAARIYTVLDEMRRRLGPLFIIEGGADGADALAARWALDRGQAHAQVRANWGHYSRGAGPLRNGWMLALEPHCAVGFPGGAGTKDMVVKLTGTDVPTMIVGPRGNIDGGVEILHDELKGRGLVA
jgi:hypothetical protein